MPALSRDVDGQLRHYLPKSSLGLGTITYYFVSQPFAVSRPEVGETRSEITCATCGALVSYRVQSLDVARRRKSRLRVLGWTPLAVSLSLLAATLVGAFDLLPKEVSDAIAPPVGVLIAVLATIGIAVLSQSGEEQGVRKIRASRFGHRIGAVPNHHDP